MMNRKPNYRIAIYVVAILTLIVSPASARLSFAGNVQVSVQNGNLLIQGDDRGNNIMITENSITGRAGTTINGERHIFIPEGATTDIVINMKGGNDFVRIELPGTNFAVPNNLIINTGSGDDTLELLQLKAPNETQIDTGNGNDIIFIDGVLLFTEFINSEFTGKFTLQTGSGDDLFEFHHAIFRGAVDVKLGSGIDGACSTEDSEFLVPEQASFNGGTPSGFPGDGFVAPSQQFTSITDFENFPDDCSFLGGRF